MGKGGAVQRRVLVTAGWACLAAGAVLFTRAGYGPLADPHRRGQPCTASRCRHNAAAATAVGLGLLAVARAR
jgi:hypothetical protein